MRRLLVDADACPVRAEVIRAGRDHGWPVILVAGPSQVLEEGPGVEVVRVDAAPQAADLELANRATAGDLVVTGDLGLAALALARGARVLDFRGRVVRAENIDSLLATRHLAWKTRRGGGRTRGPRAMDAEDRARFREALGAVLSEGGEPGLSRP